MKIRANMIWTCGIAVLVAAALVAGCAQNKASQAAGAPAAEPKASAAPAELGGAQLWAENCSQCHNARSPSDYSDAQWDLAVMHMRIQARLPGDEARKIRQFLQASN
jgi:cytochrome c5